MLSAVAIDDLDTLTRHLLAINRYELARVHADWFGAYAPTPDRRRDPRWAAGRAGRVRRGPALADVFTASLLDTLDVHDADAWLTPAATGPAPRGLDSIGDPAMSAPFSLARLPAITVPAGRLDGLPVGLQLVGRPDADADLLAYALAVAGSLTRRA